MGRTGRKRSGKIILLVGDGKEESKLVSSDDSSKNIEKLMKNPDKFKLSSINPRVIPDWASPVNLAQDMNISGEFHYSQIAGKGNSSSHHRNETSSFSSRDSGPTVQSYTLDHIWNQRKKIGVVDENLIKKSNCVSFESADCLSPDSCSSSDSSDIDISFQTHSTTFFSNHNDNDDNTCANQFLAAQGLSNDFDNSICLLNIFPEKIREFYENKFNCKEYLELKTYLQKAQENLENTNNKRAFSEDDNNYLCQKENCLKHNSPNKIAKYLSLFREKYKNFSILNENYKLNPSHSECPHPINQYYVLRDKDINNNTNTNGSSKTNTNVTKFFDHSSTIIQEKNTSFIIALDDSSQDSEE